MFSTVWTYAALSTLPLPARHDGDLAHAGPVRPERNIADTPCPVTLLDPAVIAAGLGPDRVCQRDASRRRSIRRSMSGRRSAAGGIRSHRHRRGPSRRSARAGEGSSVVTAPVCAGCDRAGRLRSAIPHLESAVACFGRVRHAGVDLSAIPITYNGPLLQAVRRCRSRDERRSFAQVLRRASPNHTSRCRTKGLDQ